MIDFPNHRVPLIVPVIHGHLPRQTFLRNNIRPNQHTPHIGPQLKPFSHVRIKFCIIANFLRPYARPLHPGRPRRLHPPRHPCPRLHRIVKVWSPILDPPVSQPDPHWIQRIQQSDSLQNLEMVVVQMGAVRRQLRPRGNRAQRQF